MQHCQSIDHDDGDTLSHLTSPMNKPQTSSGVPNMLMPTGGQFSPGGHGGLGMKKDTGGMGKKVFSMMDLSAAADESANASPMPGKHIYKPGQPLAAASSKKKPAKPIDLNDPHDIGVESSDSDYDEPILEHTVGRPRAEGGMKRVQSELQFQTGNLSPVRALPTRPMTKVQMLVVFDMDHTMVGDLVSLSDRDNIETNVPWTFWPEGRSKGLTPDYILQFFHRGMMRPGMIDVINFLEQVGATIVVYTHSEEKWASKVCEAMEKMVGHKFITRLFSRMDCRDGHPDFTARKSLEFVINECARLDGITWANMENTIMFDDDGNALNQAETHRLVKVASYDFWEQCQWDEVVNEEMMARNPPDLADMVRRSVIEWGIAPPSYGKKKRSMEDVKRDARWAVQRQQKQQILVSFNKVAQLDRVMFDMLDVMKRDLTDIVGLTDRIRIQLGKSTQPASRRQK
mmetsp:Transcript_38217/g.93921  ORF Transcript_38217/g.93921 Transcript_38217/m.93921 type:complete len:458 (+) Transcript_38217:167-1540(+)